MAIEISIRMVGGSTEISEELAFISETFAKKVDTTTPSYVKFRQNEVTIEEQKIEMDRLRGRIVELEGHLAHATGTRDLKEHEIKPIFEARVSGKPMTDDQREQVREAVGALLGDKVKTKRVKAPMTEAQIKAAMMRAVKLPDNMPTAEGLMPAGIWRATPAQYAAIKSQRVYWAGGWIKRDPEDDAGTYIVFMPEPTNDED